MFKAASPSSTSNKGRHEVSSTRRSRSRNCSGCCLKSESLEKRYRKQERHERSSRDSESSKSYRHQPSYTKKGNRTHFSHEDSSEKRSSNHSFSKSSHKNEYDLKKRPYFADPIRERERLRNRLETLEREREYRRHSPPSSSQKKKYYKRLCTSTKSRSRSRSSERHYRGNRNHSPHSSKSYIRSKRSCSPMRTCRKVIDRSNEHGRSDKTEIRRRQSSELNQVPVAPAILPIPVPVPMENSFDYNSFYSWPSHYIVPPPLRFAPILRPPIHPANLMRLPMAVPRSPMAMRFRHLAINSRFNPMAVPKSPVAMRLRHLAINSRFNPMNVTNVSQNSINEY